MIKIGDIVRHVPNIEGHQYMSPMPCRVVWIHPDEVFYTVEFTFERNRRFRESYFMHRTRVKE